MSLRETQKAEKLKIEDMAQQKLENNLLKSFEDFLEFLKGEKISTPWKSINGFRMNYKGKRVGGIAFLGSGGWDDGITEAKNCVNIQIATTEWYRIVSGKHFDSFPDYDRYLEGQSDEVAGMFMERMGRKCIHARETCGYWHTSGRSYQVMGKTYKNVCGNGTDYSFRCSGDDMNEMMIFHPCSTFSPIPDHPVPMETIKKLILARKTYIEKMLAAEK